MYKSLLYNMSQVYGLIGEYKKSIEKNKACIFTEMLYSQGHSMCRVIFNIGWCYGKMMLESNDEEKKRSTENTEINIFWNPLVLLKFIKIYMLLK